jgi:4-amino-4-deoxy-L-arabinose transferase-like glycosyltransferase
MPVSTITAGDSGTIAPFRRFNAAALICLLGIVLLAGYRFSRSATSASELIIDPDEVEYVSGAVSLATGHGYNVDFAGRRLRSQYPPGFSVLLCPIYRFFQSPGAGIYLITGFGLLGVVCVYLAAFWLEGLAAAALAALAVVAEPSIAASTRRIMSDVPSMSLGLLVLVLLIRSGSHRAGLLMTAALVGATATLLRPFNIFLLLPVFFTILREPILRPRRVILLSGTIVIGSVPVLFMLVYNKLTFGEFTRDGYKFWAAVPYDYLSMEFSPRYLKVNLGLLRERSIAITALVGIASFAWATAGKYWKVKPHWRELFAFTALALVPMTLAYGVYYFPANRMHLTTFSVACIAGASVLAAVSRDGVLGKIKKELVLIPLAGLAACAIYGRFTTRDPHVRRDAAAYIAQNIPAGSAIISTLDPVYFSLAADPNAKLDYLPFSRLSPKMAALMMTAHRIAHLDPPPDSLAPSCPGMLNGGAIWLFPTTAVEDPAWINAHLTRGDPVFLDLSWADPDDHAPAVFLRNWNTRLVNPSTRLYQLQLKSAPMR